MARAPRKKKKIGSQGAGARGRRERAPLTSDLAGAAELARRRFGIATLHPLQERALEAVLAGRDTLAVLPTGYGKSLIYQLPALLASRPTIVVSPLIALMADQERSLARRGAPVIRIDSTLTVRERRGALERLEQGGALIVLTTPETLQSEGTGAAFRAARPWLLVVDEAHCISEWGHDFRPAYLSLGTARKGLGKPQVLALTATATPRVQEHIAERLALRKPELVLAPPHRANLRLEVELVTAASKPERAGLLIRRLPRPGIVYCATTVETDRIAAALSKGKIPTLSYHGRMKKAEREKAAARYSNAKKGFVMVATSAFGMGIDRADIRWVMHYQAPGSIEQYVQEAGRAGRDGKPARCILLYDSADLAIQRHLQRQGSASGAQVLKVVKALSAWAGEERAASASELALSAAVPVTAARAVCSQLEEMGALETEARRYALAIGKRQLATLAKDLARRVDTRRREDEERLEALDAYANTDACRSAFVRAWFGEEDPPRCGICDRCKVEPPPVERPSRRSRGKRAPQRRPGTRPKESGRPKRRRRRRKGKGQGAGSGQASADGAKSKEATPQSRKKPRRRRRRRRGSSAPKGE